MYSFLVGGFIPGTNIQLSFQAYIGLMAVLLGVAAILRIELLQHQRFVRQPLHASQLHLRAL